MILKGLTDLHGTSAVGISLDHTHHLGLWLQERAVIVQIVNHCIKVHLKYRLMHLLLQLFRNLVETETACSLQQD